MPKTLIERWTDYLASIPQGEVVRIIHEGRARKLMEIFLEWFHEQADLISVKCDDCPEVFHDWLSLQRHLEETGHHKARKPGIGGMHLN